MTAQVKRLRGPITTTSYDVTAKSSVTAQPPPRAVTRNMFSRYSRHAMQSRASGDCQDRQFDVYESKKTAIDMAMHCATRLLSLTTIFRKWNSYIHVQLSNSLPLSATVAIHHTTVGNDTTETTSSKIGTLFWLCSFMHCNAWQNTLFVRSKCSQNVSQESTASHITPFCKNCPEIDSACWKVKCLSQTSQYTQAGPGRKHLAKSTCQCCPQWTPKTWPIVRRDDAFVSVWELFVSVVEAFSLYGQRKFMTQQVLVTNQINVTNAPHQKHLT